MPDRPALPPCPYCGHEHDETTLKCTKTDMVLPLAGRLLDGKFRLLAKLGKGGMASVWSATNIGVDKTVAIKLIRPEVLRDESLVARFRSEAKAAGRIGHPNVCEILDFGIGPVGPYIVMEHLDGFNLAQLLAREGPMDPAHAIAIVSEALAGLAAAHDNGIVHRDLKPENVFVHVPPSGAPVVKLMDFGVAKFTDGSGEIETEHGALLGTPEYMAPEQFMGADLAEPRTDLWAVGAILYRALTGQHPFKGPTVAATLMLVTHEEPADIHALAPEVPDELAEVIERCLRKSPEDRFPDARALDDALGAVVDPASLIEIPGVAGIGRRATEGDFLETPDGADPELAPVDNEVITRPRVGRADDEAPPAGLPDPQLGQVEAGVDDPTTIVAIGEPARPRWLAWGVAAVALTAVVALGVAATSEPSAPEVVTASVGGSSGSAAPAAAPPDLGPAPAPEAAEEPVPAEPQAQPTDVPAPSPDHIDADPSADEPLVIVDDEESPANAEPREPKPANTASNPPAEPDGKDAVVAAGKYWVAAKRGPRSTHGDARKYCQALALTGYAGLKGWKLPFPDLIPAISKAKGLGRGRYWTSARWQNRARVYVVPTGRTLSADAQQKNAKALCVTRRPV